MRTTESIEQQLAPVCVCTMINYGEFNNRIHSAEDHTELTNWIAHTGHGFGLWFLE